MTDTGASAGPSGFLPRAIAFALSLKPVRAFLLYSERSGSMLADSVTYRTLFSVFAGVLLGFSIAALVLSGNPAAWQALIDAVDAAVPGLVGKGGLIDPSSIAIPAGLTVAGVLSLVGLVGAAIGAIASLRLAIRQLADRLAADLEWYWVILRNLGLAVAIGAALGVSAVVTMLTTAGIGIVAGWLGMSGSSAGVVVGTRVLSIVLVFALDAVAIAVLFRVLSGLRPSPRALWSGAVLGAVGLTVLQQLSGLFVGGAKSNPLLASFAALIALLLWLNLSAQVILIASAYIIVGVQEETDRVSARYGATTFAQRRVKRAQALVDVASQELRVARDAEEKERTGS